MTMEAGKLWDANPLRFATLVNATQLRWRAFTSEVRVGKDLGRTPFDERFMIGIERDSNLWLRAHAATVDGRKNAANTSASFVVTNSDFQKTVFNAGWFQLSAGPFLDTGKSSISQNWLVDTGVETRLRILGAFGISVSYGKSPSDGHHAVFVRQNTF